MRKYLLPAMFIATLGFAAFAHGKGKGDTDRVRKAVERSTLNQQGTKPFHLKAELAPSFERDKGSGRTGEVEIWWSSPTMYKREVRCPGFHQILISNGGRDWQKNDGDYFPEWLRRTAVALIEPVPALDETLKQVEDADVKRLFRSTDYSWMIPSTDGSVQTYIGAGVAIDDATNLLQFASGWGWEGSFSEYKDFHGRMVARTVKAGTPEVTANVSVLEDLRDPSPAFFDAGVAGGDKLPLRTAVVDEISMRKNLLHIDPPEWPPLQDGPLEGTVTSEIVADRTGQVREIGPIITINTNLSDEARRVIGSIRFAPYEVNGVPVQVISRISLPFKTTRPAGAETFESARSYFERGRRVGFPAAANGPPYILQAGFQVKTSSGHVENGRYVDTWKSDGEWRREASVGKSRYVRARHGEKRYQLAEGPDAPVLRFVLHTMEPIPALDTFIESDWKIKRDTVDGVRTIRVLSGYESPGGDLDPEHARAYWFDESGRLLKAYFQGLETRRSNFMSFGSVQVAHQVRVFHNGGLAMRIHVNQLSPAASLEKETFELHGHEWIRAFTDEMR